MATTNTTNVNFVKVPTMAKFEDLTSKVDGTIYFIVDAKKIYLDDVMYGFNDADVANKFVKLTGDTMTGDLTMSVESGINNTHHIEFKNGGAITGDGDGGIELRTIGNESPLISLESSGNILFNSADIRGIPEPAASNSPISKGYFENVLSGLIGVSDGIATLNESGKVPSTQLPSYVDDILDYNNSDSFPNAGESDKIYLALDTGDIWRWAGDRYVRISDGSGVLVLGNTSSTAFRGDYGDEAYTHSLMVGQGLNPHEVTAADVGLGDVKDYGIASKSEAEAGATDLKYMTPQKTKNAIEKLSPRLSWEVVE